MQMMAEILVATLRRDGMRFIMMSDKKSGVTCFFLTPIPVCACLTHLFPVCLHVRAPHLSLMLSLYKVLLISPSFHFIPSV